MSTKVRKRSTVFAQAQRQSIAPSAPTRKKRYMCRGLRQWCNERCERTTSLIPEGYPKAGFYCPVHRYQTGKNAKPKFTEFLKRIPSYERFIEKEETRSRIVGKDHQFILKLKEAQPPVIGPQKVGAKRYERAFTGEAFVRWAIADPTSHFEDMLPVLGYAQQLMQGGLIVCISDPSPDARFTNFETYQLAEDATAGGTAGLSMATSAVVRISIIQARNLRAVNSKKGTSSPCIKVAYRDIGPHSYKASTIKIGRTNVVYKSTDPIFGVTPKRSAPAGTADRMLKFKPNDAPDTALGRIVRSSVVAWPRNNKPAKAPPEWDTASVDAYTFQFRVPQPRTVYKDHHEMLPFKKCPGDVHITCMHQQRGGSDVFLGEIGIPIANLVTATGAGEETARPCLMRWIHLYDKPKAGDTRSVKLPAAVLIRIQMLLPTDKQDGFEASGSDSDTDDD